MDTLLLNRRSRIWTVGVLNLILVGCGSSNSLSPERESAVSVASPQENSTDRPAPGSPGSLTPDPAQRIAPASTAPPVTATDAALAVAAATATAPAPGHSAVVDTAASTSVETGRDGPSTDRLTSQSPQDTDPPDQPAGIISSLPVVNTAIAAWPQFRGPDGQGHALATAAPLRWNEKKNVAWKVPLRGLGWSSPVIADGQIWLTSAVAADHTLHVLCLDVETGALLHDIEVFRKDQLGTIHTKNSHASPTPVLEGDRCFVHFGAHGTAALSTTGQILWKTEIPYYHHHGPASSPVLVNHSLIIACDGLDHAFYDAHVVAGATDPQFVVALDAMQGTVRWRMRRDGRHSYATPLAIEVEGQTQVVSPGGSRVVAYDPSTGAEIWSCRYEGYSLVPRPVSGHGLVFVCTGYDVATLLAIRPTGHGDITDSHVAWQAKQGVPLNASPILIGDELYTISDQGVATCWDALTGKVHWKKRLGGNHSASPLLADGKLYVLDETGTTHVLQPGTKPKVLAKNVLRGKTLASLAAYGRAIYLRSDSHLYRLEEPATSLKSEPGAPADSDSDSDRDPDSPESE
ncbi:MAG: PQQ-binding-like beta-propeller repeat protein [Planctomycetes bacterium]|nr:PQQ-binding-like beta-propeller repeat protein [Planctomycetota bacterium]